MNNEKIAKVYLDNQPISLLDPRPMVSSILFSCGKPESSTVQLLESRTDLKGKALAPEAVVDRTSDPTKPIYLTSTAAAKFGRSQEVATPASAAVAPVPKPAWGTKASADSGDAKDKAKDEHAKADDAEPEAGEDAPGDEPSDDDDADPAKES